MSEDNLNQEVLTNTDAPVDEQAPEQEDAQVPAETDPPPESEAKEEPEVDPAFEEFSELRVALDAAGVDMKAMTERFHEDALTDEDIETLAQHHGSRPEDVRAHLKVKRNALKLQEKVSTYEQAEVEKFESQYDEVAGGSWREMVDAVQASEEIPLAQKKIWKSALDSEGTNEEKVTINKLVLSQMKAELDKLKPSEAPAPPKRSDLALTTQANPSSNPIPTKQPEAEAEADPLKDNPFVKMPYHDVARLAQNLVHKTTPLSEEERQILEVAKSHDLV